MEPQARVEAHFRMRDELRGLTQREIDLAMAGAVKNPDVSREIELTKKLTNAV
jgi:predicted nucleotidyltransferase